MKNILQLRSLGRDLKTDESRFQEVRTKINSTIAEIEREIAGLTTRLEHARDHAAILLGNEDGIYHEREPSVELLLRDAEKQMYFAAQRLKFLANNRAKYTRLLELLEN